MSHLSTTSEGEQCINNNLYLLQSNQNNKRGYNKKLNLNESIQMGIQDISDCFNSYKNESNVISFACYYYCDIYLDKEKEFFLGVRIQQLIDDYQKNKNFK